MKTIDVSFIGGPMSGIMIAMAAEQSVDGDIIIAEFKDGDILNFQGGSYLMKEAKGYFISGGNQTCRDARRRGKEAGLKLRNPMSQIDRLCKFQTDLQEIYDVAKVTANTALMERLVKSITHLMKQIKEQEIHDDEVIRQNSE